MSLQLKLRPAKILKIEVWPESTNCLPTAFLMYILHTVKKSSSSFLRTVQLFNLNYIFKLIMVTKSILVSINLTRNGLTVHTFIFQNLKFLN